MSAPGSAGSAGFYQAGALERELVKAQAAIEAAQRAQKRQHQYNWEKLARELRGRVQHQRTQLKDLNKLVISLRAEAHYWREKAEGKP